MEILNNNIFNRNIFNNFIFNNTGFLNNAFNQNAFQRDPFNNIPFIQEKFDPTPFNKELKNIQGVPEMRTPLDINNYYGDIFERLRYKRYLISQRTKDQNISEHYLVNYNDPLEINSLRDVILGSMNSNMKHAIEGSNIQGLNIMTDTIMHSWKHFLQPTLKGRINEAFLNLLTELSEDLDIIANPIKATAQSIIAGEDVGQALLRSTFGDETGIHNYDWDTGNMLADIILEFASDPLNWVSLGGKSAVTSLIDITEEGVQKTFSKTAIKEISQELSEKAGKRVTMKQTKKLLGQPAKALNRGLKWNVGINASDMAKKGVLNNEIQDKVLTYMKKKYTKTFSKNLKYTLDLSADSLEKATMQGILSGIETMGKSTMLKMSTDVTASLGLKMVRLEDAITGSLVKHGLRVSGVYPAYASLKAGGKSIGTLLSNLTIAKASQHHANEVLDKFKTFLQTGDYDGAFEVLVKDINLKNLDPSLAKATADTPEELLGPLAKQFGLRVVDAKKALQNLDVTADVKENEILNYFQSMFSHFEIKSMDDVINIVDTLDKQALKVGNDLLVESGFSGIKQAVNDISNDLKRFKLADKLKQQNELNRPVIDAANDIKQFAALNAQGERNFNVHKFVDRVPLTKAYVNLKEYPKHIINNITWNNADSINIAKSALLDLKSSLQDIPRIGVPGLRDDFDTIVDLIDEILNTIKTISLKGYSETHLYSKLNELESTIDYLLKHRLKDRIPELMIDPIFYDLVFLKDEFGRYTVNETLINNLKNTKYVPEFPDDFTKTTTFKNARDVLAQEHRNSAIIQDIEESIKQAYDDVYVKSFKANLERVQEVAKLTESSVITNDKILKHTGTEIISEANKALNPSGILSVERSRELNKHLDIIDKAIKDHLEPNALKKEIYSSSIDGVMHNLKQSIQEYRIILKAITESDPDFYHAIYEFFYERHKALLKELEKLRQYLDNASIYDPKNLGVDIEDLRGVLSSDQPRIITGMVKEYYDKYGNLLRPIDIEKHSESIIEHISITHKYYDAITGHEIEDSLVRRVPEFRAKNTHSFLGDLTRDELYKMLPSQKIVDANKALKDLESVLYDLNPEIHKSSMLGVNRTFDLMRLKMESSVVRAKLNNLDALVDLKNDVYMRGLIDTIINVDHSDQLKAILESSGFDKESQKVLMALAAKLQEIDNANEATHLMDALVDGFDYSKDEKMILKTAMHSVADYASRQNVFTATAESLSEEFIKNVQGYRTGVDLTAKSYSVDALLKRCAKEQGKPLKIVEKEIMDLVDNLKIPDDIYKLDDVDKLRHSAVYDTVAQIYLYENLTGKDFSGYMLDIETTKLLNKRNRTNGKITEIAVIHKANDGTLSVAYKNRVKATKETIENYYALTKDTYRKMKTSHKAHMSKHISDTDEVLEENILNEFYNFLKTTPSKSVMGTFNGDEFDIVYLIERLKNTVNDAGDIIETFKQFEMVDYYKELSPDRFRFTSFERAQIQNMFQNIIDKQRRTVGKYRMYYDLPINVIGGVNSGFATVLKDSINIDNLNALDETTRRTIEQILDFFEEEEDLAEFFMNVVDTDAMQDLQTLGINIFHSNIHPTLRNHLLNIFNEYIDTVRDIGVINDSLSAHLIPSYLFDVEHPKHKKYHTRILKKLQDYIINQLPEGNMKQYLLENARPATNLTQLLTLGITGDPMFAYKKYRGDVYELWNAVAAPLTPVTNNSVYNNLLKIIGKNDQLYNVDSIVPFKKEIYNMLSDIKKAGLTIEARGLVIDRNNLQFAYAELDFLWNQLTARANQDYLTSPKVREFIGSVQDKYSNLIKFLNDGTPYIKVHINGEMPEFIRPDTVQWVKDLDYTDELTALKDLSKRNLDPIKVLLKETKEPLSVLKTAETAGTLHQKLLEINLNNANRRVINTLTQVNVSTTHLRYANALHQVLKADPKALLSDILYTNADHIKVICKPKNNNYFNNLDAFNVFLAQKEIYENVGIKVEYDEVFEKIYLSLDPNKVKITLNKGLDGIRYCVNGEPIANHIYEGLPQNIFKAYITGPASYTEDLYKWMFYLEQMQPELRGRVGLTQTLDRYQEMKTLNTFNEFNGSTLIDGDDFLPYFNNTYVGEYEELVDVLGPMRSDILYSLAPASGKITTHTAKHIEYAKYVAESGLMLDDKVFKNISAEELSDWLNTNKDWVVVYLADAKRAIGGVEIRRINKFNAKTMELAAKKHATIIPYRQYIRAANNINNYHYGNRFEWLFGQIASAYKAGWLVSTGVIFRNIIDSGMKNYIEGGSIPEVTENYIDAVTLYNKYIRAMDEIRLLDETGNYRYTFENADLYFKYCDPIIDSETYHFVYDFLNESGMNTLRTGDMGLFEKAMKPMSYIEKINRLAMYINLSNQGEEYSKIIRKIAETHFDYSTKTQLDFIVQTYLPFWTYASSNIEYIAHLIDEHPSFLRNYFNFYTPIWDFDSLNYEELTQNLSLQSQIINGNIPLELFGYKDKEITRTVDTKYGPKEQVATNTAVLKMGSSFLDGLSFFVSPLEYFKEKLAPPVQVVTDSVLEYAQSAFGNISGNKYSTYEESENYYNYNFGSTSVQNLIKDPSKLTSLAPGLTALIPNDNIRALASIGMTTFNRYKDSKVKERTGNDIIAAVPSIFGATNRWGEFVQNNKNYKTYKYPKRYYKRYAKRARRFYARKSYTGTPGVNQGMSRRGYSVYYSGYPGRSYPSGRRASSSYNNYLYNTSHPYRIITRRNLPILKSIPQHLHSYNGLNKYGKSKRLSWMRMNTRFKVKSTLRRLAS